MSDDVLERIAKLGEHGLDAAERETLGMGKAGLRFGTASHNVRLPGTGGLSTGIGKSLGAVRGTATDTAFGRTARKLGGSRTKALRPFVERISAGTGDMSLRGAGVAYNAMTNRAGAEAGFIGRWAPSATKAANELRGNGSALRAAEKIGATHGPEAQVVRDFFDQVYDDVVDAGVTGLKDRKREGYVTHYQSDDLKNFLGDDAVDLTVVDAVGMSTGRLDPRIFKPGAEVTIKGQKVKFGNADIDDIESKLWASVPRTERQEADRGRPFGRHPPRRVGLLTRRRSCPAGEDAGAGRRHQEARHDGQRGR